MGGGNRNANFADESFGEARFIRNLLPTITAISRFVKAAVGSAARQFPEIAIGLPYRRVQNAGVIRIHRQINCARFFAPKQNIFPSCSAVFRAKDAALFVRPKSVTECRHIDQIGVLRMNANFADMTGFLQADVCPSFTAIGRLVHPITVGDIEADGSFACAGVDNVWIGIRHCDCPYGSTIEKSVRNIFPVRSGIVSFPDTTGTCAKVEHRQFCRMSRHSNNTPASWGTDTAPFE